VGAAQVPAESEQSARLFATSAASRRQASKVQDEFTDRRQQGSSQPATAMFAGHQTGY
jgi:hypothetical protein